MSGEAIGPDGGMPAREELLPSPDAVPQVPGAEASPTEKASVLSAESRTTPFIVYRDVNGRQRIYELPESGQVTIGRGLWTDISLNWDDATSRLHARLESLSDDWTVVDDGTSRNGTFLNGERVEGRRRLADGDELLIGGVALRVHMPGRVDGASTVVFEPGELPLGPDAQA